MKSSEINILIAGDYHTYGRYATFIKNNPEHNVFSDSIKKIVAACELSVFNLEDPITESQERCIKYGPYGIGNEQSLAPIAEAGFKIATFATNHSYDAKNQGILDTIRICKNMGIKVIGAGVNSKEARKIYYQQVNNYSIALLNFSRKEYNVAGYEHGGANSLDVIDNSYDIKTAKKQSDFVFIVVHEGPDLFSLPYPELKKQMRFYVDMGADAIVLHHSRVISGYEIYKGSPIFYGIGNLLHFNENPIEHKGLMVKFSISSNGLRYELIPVIFSPDDVRVFCHLDTPMDDILESVEKLSDIIQDDLALQSAWEKNVDSKKFFYLGILAGYPNVFYRLARKLRMLSLYERLLLINRKRLIALKGLFTCQAHREATEQVLKKFCDD